MGMRLAAEHRSGGRSRFGAEPRAAVRAKEQIQNEDEEAGVDETRDESVEPPDPDMKGHPEDGEPGGPVGASKEERSGEEAENADEVDPEVLRAVGGQNVAVVEGEADDVDDEVEPANEGDGEGPLHKCWVPV